MFTISGAGVHMTGAAVFLPLAVLIGALFSFIPYLSRKTDLFGISIPASEFENPALVAMRRSYRNRSLLVNAVLCAVMVALQGVKMPEEALSAVLFLQLAIYFVLYLFYHKKAKEFKAAQNWENRVCSTIAVDLSPAARSYISPAWLLLNPLVVALTASLGFQFYAAAPDRLVKNWNLSGVPTAYVDKSYGVIWFFLFMQAMMTLLFSLIFFMTKNARRQLDAENPQESARRVEVFRKSWGWFIVFAGAGTNFVFLISMLCMLEAISMATAAFWMILLLGAIMIGSLALSFFVGQGGSRIKFSAEKNTRISVQDDDKFWKLGTIYFNPDDPSVFVEKRFGLGWTCNFARPLSWVCLAGLFLFIFLSIFIANYLLG